MTTPVPSVSAAPRAEVQQRFRRLRRLRHDPAYRLRVFGIISLVFLALFVLLTLAVATFPFIEYDLNSTRTLQQIQHPYFTALMVAVSWFGYIPGGPIVVFGALFVVWRWLGGKEALYYLAFTVGEGIVAVLIKEIIGRPRPTADVVNVFTPVDGASFPSGHVVLYTVFFGYLFFLAAARLPRSWLRTLVLVVTAALVVLVGPSRMFLGAHWLTDVLASYSIGLVILLIAIEGHLRYLAPRTPAQEEGALGAHDQNKA